MYDLFRVTHTKVQSFLRCRKQYWFNYVSGYQYPEEEETAPIVIGNAVHRGMQELCESGDVEVTRQRVDAYLRMPKHEAAGPGTEHYDTAMEILERGIAAHESIETVQTWGELSTWAPWKSAGITVMAKADRIDRLPDGTFQVIDWKTGRFDDPALLDDQLDLSHVAVRISLRLKRDQSVTAVGWNLRSGIRRDRPLVQADAQAAMKRAYGLAQRMWAETDFPATPGPQCTFCRWRDRCDEAELVESGREIDELMAGIDLDEVVPEPLDVADPFA
jgi:hypothetical protein